MKSPLFSSISQATPAPRQGAAVRFFAIFLLALLSLTFGAMAARAQATAQISGTVSDTTGAVLPNSSVTLKNVDTNGVRTTTANSAGLYTFNNLQPGSYVVSATGSGFSAYSARIVVTVGGNFTINPKLGVSSSAVVDVSAVQTLQVNTTSPEISTVIDQDQMSQFPSLTRNPYDFVSVVGNVSSGDATAAGNTQNGANRGVNFSLNGQRNSGTEILLDGVENLQIFGDAVAIRVPIDDVQEYRVITNNFAPEYGRASGGVVALATKSGTNQFHGTVFGYNRISALTANTVTNAQSGIARGIYTRNQFGAAVGGPIVKDKLFFFASSEFLRVRSGANTIGVVPTAQFLATTASNVQSFFSTYGGATAGNTISTTTNLQAGGGTSPLYSALAPNFPLFNNIAFTSPQDAGGGTPQNTYNVTGRVDYNLGDKTQAFFRYVDYNEIDQAGSNFASPYAKYDVGAAAKAQAYLLSVAHEFSPALSTIAKASFSRNTLSNSYNTALQNVPTLNIAPSAYDPYTFNTFLLPGFYSATPANGGLPYGGPQNVIQYNQDVNYTVSKHQLQAGGQVLYIQENQAYGAYAQANEQFGSSQAKGLTAFPNGTLYQYQVAVNPQGATPCSKNPYTGVITQTPACTINLPASSPSFARSDRFHDWAAYVQDQFKATNHLTLNYGVRYEYFGVQHNNNQNLDSNFYYGAGTSIPQQVRSGSVLTVPNSPIKKLWNPQYGTVSPRVGFALDIFGDGKTSLRGGYGISYERNFGNVTFNLIQNPPNYAVIVTRPSAVTNSNLGPVAAASGSVPLPPTSLRHVDQNIRTAQTQFWSLAVDQQLGHSAVVEVAYNGARGIHLYDIKNYNIPGAGNIYLGDPAGALSPINYKYSNDNNRGSNGDSYYQAVNVSLNVKDYRHSGLSLTANYTLAHALDDLSSTFSETSAGNFELGYTDAFNPRLDHGSSDFDIRHRLVVAPLYKTPFFFKDKGGYVSQLLGGYEVTGIFTLRTGTPFTLYDSTNNNSGYQIIRYTPAPGAGHYQDTFREIPTGTPNNGNVYQLGSIPTAIPQYNPIIGGYSDFGPYTGMSGRNSFRGPGAYNLDVSFSKSIPIYKRTHLELRAEAFNVLNHHNLYIQQSALDVANAQGPNFAGGPVSLATSQQTDSPYLTGTTYPVTARKGGISGGAGDERRFLQFAGKINF